MVDNVRPLSQIRPDRLYSLSEICRLSGLKMSTIRTAKKHGLRVRYFSRFAWVSGADFIAFIQEHSKDHKDDERMWHRSLDLQSIQ